MVKDTTQTSREQPEPRELRHPLPWSMRILMISLTCWGVFYFFSVADSPAPAGDMRTIGQAVPKVVNGAVIFNAQCAACHQTSGMGLPGAFPPLVDAKWVTGNPMIPIQILLAGLEGPIEVKGQLYQGQMPAFGGSLNDDEIAAVVNHIRTSWGNTASEVDAGQVENARSEMPSKPWTAKGLLDKYGQ